jgi:TolA-binding protein
MPKTLKEEDGGIAQPIQAMLEELEKLRKRVEELEEKKRKEEMEEEEEESEEEEKLKERKKEKTSKGIRIYREIDLAQPGRNPVKTPELGANPVGNVPGEGKYVEKAVYDEGMRKIEGRIRRLEEAVGLDRQPDIAGAEEPFDMMAERIRESLSKRKTVLTGGVSREGFDIKSAVKAYLGGVA